MFLLLCSNAALLPDVCAVAVTVAKSDASIVTNNKSFFMLQKYK